MHIIMERINPLTYILMEDKIMSPEPMEKLINARIITFWAPHNTADLIMVETESGDKYIMGVNDIREYKI